MSRSSRRNQQRWLTQFSGCCCVLCIHSQADDFVHINHRGRAATKIMVQQEETARAWRGMTFLSGGEMLWL
jgi:hypothetical protein